MGKILAFIGAGVTAFGIILMINDDGGTITSLAIPFIFIGLLVIMASILFIRNLNKKVFLINNFIFLFMLIALNAIALFGALFSKRSRFRNVFCIWAFICHLGYLIFPSICTTQEDLANFLVSYYGNIIIHLANRSWL